MAAELQKLAQELRGRGYVDGSQRISETARALKEKGFIPESLELQGLEAEWERQAQRYIELGYNTELGLTEETYLASLPKFEAQPKEYEGRLDVPLLIETRIPYEKQAQLAGISLSDYLKSNIKKTRPFNNHSKPPKVAYAGWFNSWGQRFTDPIRPFDARKELTKDECGAGPFEGIAMQVHHPEFGQNNKFFDLIGYSVESGNVPYLDRWYGRPRLDACWSGCAGDHFRPLVRGSKIVTG